jgi:dienelactone hydrolase
MTILVLLKKYFLTSCENSEDFVIQQLGPQGFELLNPPLYGNLSVFMSCKGDSMKLFSFMISFVLLASLPALAKVKTENVEYKDGKTTLEGFLAYDDSIKGPRPAVLLVHDWMGLKNNTKERAKQVAQMGYVAFALDIYGKGVRPSNSEEASKLASMYKDNRKMMRERAQAGFDFIKKNKKVDASKIVAIGYCFGGTVVLEMGRAGLPLVGIATFHGGLSNPTPADAKNIKGQVLVMHGALDPYVPFTEVEAFEKEMNDAGVEYTLVKYSGAVHAFTIKEAGNDIKSGAAYNARADKLSWIEFTNFLKEVAPIKK